MKNTFLLVLLISILPFVGFISCDTNKDKTKLKDADKIIEENPSVALNILSNINQDDLSHNDFAYYALLFTQAQIKCGINVSSDSLIRIAYKYYKDSKGGDLYIRAYFYNAKISYNNENFHEAMKDALMAYDYAKEHNNYYWIAKSSELISDIFFDVFNYSQAESYTIEAIDNYGFVGKKINQRYSICDLATIYLNENKDAKAIELADSIYKVVLSEEKIDPFFEKYLNNTIITIKQKTGQLEDIDIHDYIILSEDSTKDEIIEYKLINSQQSISDGNYDISNTLLADALLLATSKQQRAQVLYAAYLNAKSISDYQTVASLADSLLILQSDIAESILKESVTGVQRDFYSNKATKNKQRSKQLFYILITVSIITIIITLLIITIFRLKIKNKETDLESAMTSLLYLKEQSDKYNSQVKLLSDKLNNETLIVTKLKQELDNKLHIETKNEKLIETLFKEKWTTINMLCNEYFEKGKNEITRNSILHNIEEELKKLRSKKSLKQLEDAVDRYLGGIMSLLRNECSFLREDDFTFLSLVFAGFSVRAVCLFTDIKYKLFYLKKSRLTKRIASSEAPHKHIFLEKLS